LAGLVVLWSTNPSRLHVAKIPIGVATNGCGEWGDVHLAAPLPDNSKMIVIVVSVWIVMFM